MLPQEIIRKKRDGGMLETAEIAEFIEGVTTGRITEGQVAAFCMAVFWRGTSMPERVALTRAMANSGRMMEWKSLNLPGPVVDKHSTGGVGDKTSLVLAPILAACGAFVPMISGRGLGHTGGTLDKFDSIPGYQAQPDIDLFRQVVQQAGCAIIGQTPDLAPADKRIYAIRDTTATVESLSLITASILAKKIAAGLDVLVMDVKYGNGAFLPEYDRALELAQSIATVATGAGVKTTALLTDMNQVLGSTAGNAVEVQECVDWFRGGKPEARLKEVTFALSAELLVNAGLAADNTAALAQCEQAMSSGKAAEIFSRMVAGLGGPKDFLDKSEAYLPKAPVELAVDLSAGYVTGMDTRGIGIALVELGAGRASPQEPVDHAVGLSKVAQIGDAVGPGQPFAVVHARTTDQAERMAAQLRRLVNTGSGIDKKAPVLMQKVTAQP